MARSIRRPRRGGALSRQGAQSSQKENPAEKKEETSKGSKTSEWEADDADRYDKGDGQVGHYPRPTHTSYPSAYLYSSLKNNRNFRFKYGMPEEKIMDQLKDHKGNVKISYHNNAGTLEIYRVKFI